MEGNDIITFIALPESDGADNPITLYRMKR